MSLSMKYDKKLIQAFIAHDKPQSPSIQLDVCIDEAAIYPEDTQKFVDNIPSLIPYVLQSTMLHSTNGVAFVSIILNPLYTASIHAGGGPMLRAALEVNLEDAIKVFLSKTNL